MVRKLLGGALVAAVLSTAAAWSEPDAPFHPEYDIRPDAQDFANNYPRGAMELSMQGVAVLCCLPREDRTLACQRAYEWPVGMGFGPAAENIAQSFKLTPESYDDYQAQPRPPIRTVITFRIYGQSADALRQAAENTANICVTAAPAP